MLLGHQPVAASSFHDVPSVVAIAESASAWVRRIAGESERSMEANPVDVSSYTSEVPEALQKYYEALEFYAIGEMESAVLLLKEAIGLDPQFAQAHNMLGTLYQRRAPLRGRVQRD